MVSPKLSGADHMRTDLDLFLLQEKNGAKPALRIYSWQPKCISLGYSQVLEEEIDAEKAKQSGWDIIQRPTGGGIVFHDEAEVTYSLIIQKSRLPAGLVPSFRKISEAIIMGLKVLGIRSEIQTSNVKLQNNMQMSKNKSQLCFSYPEGYEIVADGKKIVGAAQKRGERTILQQGSIYVKAIEMENYRIIRKPYQEPDAVSVQEILGRIPSFEELSQALISGFREGLGFEI